MKDKVTSKSGKMKANVYGKDSYFLGKRDGHNLWLTTASWDCSWYWGFGYCVTRDSHEHYDSITGRGDDGRWHHLLSEAGVITPLSIHEQWQLSELMKTFYTLKDMAAIYHTGGSHLTENPCKATLKDHKAGEHINNVLMPAIFAAVYKLLSPVNESEKTANLDSPE